VKKNKKDIKPAIKISKQSLIPCKQPTPPITTGKLFILSKIGQGLGDTILYQWYLDNLCLPCGKFFIQSFPLNKSENKPIIINLLF